MSWIESEKLNELKIYKFLFKKSFEKFERIYKRLLLLAGNCHIGFNCGTFLDKVMFVCLKHFNTLISEKSVLFVFDFDWSGFEVFDFKVDFIHKSCS